ncbi:magnesium chelatase, subunit ChlI [Neisseria sp. oral taxon 020 str. F0370]|nr:magnesium chelatase, subunit ChlI [Neisseria sp. oral taxon 020 str. F0370]
MNPCPCGYHGHPVKPCRCTPDAILRYRSKISGPLIDRIDLVIEVPALPADELVSAKAGEPSAAVLERVLAARERQNARQGKLNRALSPTELDTAAGISAEARETLGGILEKLSLSARSFHRIMRTARTIADLAGDTEVARGHILRAVGFRRSM